MTVNLRLGRLAQPFAPGFGWCLRCSTPWRFVKPHDTKYTMSSGCFPLCEKCWKQLERPVARLPYYRLLIDSWEKIDGWVEQDGDVWPDVEAAVMAGG